MKSTVIGILGIAAAALALPAAAQDRGVYAGVSLGQVKYGDWCSTANEVGSTSCDDKDTALRIFGGYQFHPNVAVELGYADLGNAKFSGTFLGLPVTGNEEFTAWDVVAVGSWPLGTGFSVFGKLGLYLGEVTAKASVSGTTGSASDSGADLTLGAGVAYDFTRNLGARLEWQRYNDFSDAGAVDVISIGVLYRFR